MSSFISPINYFPNSSETIRFIKIEDNYVIQNTESVKVNIAGLNTTVIIEGTVYPAFFEYSKLKGDSVHGYSRYYFLSDNSENSQLIEFLKRKFTDHDFVECQLDIPTDIDSDVSLCSIPSLLQVNRIIDSKIQTNSESQEFGNLHSIFSTSENSVYLGIFNIQFFREYQIKIGTFEFDLIIVKDSNDVKILRKWTKDSNQIITSINIKYYQAGSIILHITFRENSNKHILCRGKGDVVLRNSEFPANGLIKNETVVLDFTINYFQYTTEYHGIENQNNRESIVLRDSIDTAKHVNGIQSVSSETSGHYFFETNDTDRRREYIFKQQIYENVNQTGAQENPYAQLLIRTSVPNVLKASEGKPRFYAGWLTQSQNPVDIQWKEFVVLGETPIGADQIVTSDSKQFVTKAERERWDSKSQTQSTWLNPVANVSSLPTTSSIAVGSRCVVLDVNKVYKYTGTTWELDGIESQLPVDREEDPNGTQNNPTSISGKKLWDINRSIFGYKVFDDGLAIIPRGSDKSKYQLTSEKNWIDLVLRYIDSENTWSQKFQTFENSVNFGINNSEAGKDSIMFGYGLNNSDLTTQSILFGYGLTRIREQIIIGKYNANNEQAVFAVGIGSSKSERKNGLEILTNGDLKIEGVFKSQTIPEGAILTNSGYIPYATVAKTEQLTGYVKKSEACIFRHVPLDFTGSEEEKRALPAIAIYN